MDDPAALAAEPYCYLTTIGRVSGRPHRIEIWFATEDGSTLLLLSGGRDRADWVRNLLAHPRVRVELRGVERAGTARVLEPADREDAVARRLLVDKYGPGELQQWGETSLAVAIDLEDARPAPPEQVVGAPPNG